MKFVYTDGACSNNGRGNAKAGIGIYFGENDPRNVSQRLEGKQTNNMAELTAILEAYHLICDELDSGVEYTVVTDSEYSLKCVGKYGEKMAKIGWCEDIPNKELVRRVYECYSKYLSSNVVSFLHIRSHTGGTDIHSLGNEQADKLAGIAIGLNALNTAPSKIFLNVPFQRKDEAKALGAKWEPSKKKWYIMTNNENKEELLKLFQLTN
jgi:ribonuclease HI